MTDTPDPMPEGVIRLREAKTLLDVAYNLMYEQLSQSAHAIPALSATEESRSELGKLVAHFEALNNTTPTRSNTRMTPEQETNHFGTCPTCHKNDGSLNIGKSHWYYCKTHRTKWYVGFNLFSSWQHQTEDEQRKRYEDLKFDTYTEVTPA